jgi:hypothetical protein
MSIAEGFNLSPFNRLAPPWYFSKAGSKHLVLRSEPADLFRFDFQSGGPYPDARALVSLSASEGRVNGIVQWLSFKMDDATSYENMPSPHRSSAFVVRVCPLERPIKLPPGTTMTVCGAHDRQSLHIWAQIPSNAVHSPQCEGHGAAPSKIGLLARLVRRAERCLAGSAGWSSLTAEADARCRANSPINLAGQENLP